MEIPLDAIEALRARVNLTYRQARDLLEETGGDLVEALIYLEENKEKFIDQAAGRGREFVHQARHLASRLHHTRVKVKDKTLLELPVTVTALGAAVFPKVAALGMIGLLLSRGSIEVKGDQAKETEPEADKSR